MPPASQPDRIEIVLVSPRNPLNIGAVARAMANFGFSRLAVVAPFEAHWQEARSAVGALDLLRNARETESLAEAVADCTLVAGTGTLTYRRPEQRVVQLPDLAPLVRTELERGGRVGLVLGPEKHGLTRDDLSFCHLLVEIPTDPRQPSMNLGQAAAVCLYELATRALAAGVHGPETSEEILSGARQSAEIQHPAVTCSGFVSGHDFSRAASGPRYVRALAPEEHSSGASRIEPALGADSGNLELLARVIEQAMEAAEYSPPSMRQANRHDLRLFLRRLALTRRDARRVLGLFRRILWRLESRSE